MDFFNTHAFQLSMRDAPRTWTIWYPVPMLYRYSLFVLGLCSCLFAEQVRESAADFDILYRTVDIDNAKYDTIITKPKAVGRYPAVLLIAGLGCYSLDRLKP